MEKQLTRGVKDVIKDYPETGEILQQYGVGCVTCEMGSCLLKDVIGVHNLNSSQEKVLMSRIEKAIYPERDIEIPEEQGEVAREEWTFSEPLQMLVMEHENIKRVLRAIPALCGQLQQDQANQYPRTLECLDFIRNYADQFHHAKEEDILFKTSLKNNEIIQTMTEEHKLGRWFVKLVGKGIEKQDNDMIQENLENYAELLQEHIRKEDELLYPFIDRQLSVEAVKGLQEQFERVNENRNCEGKIGNYEIWAKSLQ